MQDLNRKSSLLNLIQSEHAQLEALLTTLSEEQLLQPEVSGSWSVKDVLAHLTWWEQAMISEILHGVELDPGLDGEPWSTERANTLMIEAKRATPLPEILAAFRDSCQQILHMVEGLAEIDLVRDELYTHLANNTGNHYAEHRRWIEAGLKSTSL
ncbi:MAG TPA: DinB family protein [Ktedonobacteraceae bacterium]